MFLDHISTEKRELFLALCYKAICCNDEVNDAEVNQLAAYSKELHIEADFEKYKLMNTDDILSQLRSMSLVEKKIVLSELLGILMSDKVYDDLEKEFFRNAGEKMGVAYETTKEIEVGVEEYLSAYGRFVNIVLGE